MVCNYSAYYSDPRDGNEDDILFECDEEQLNSGFCKFHDKNYFRQNKDEIAHLFYTKVSQIIEKNEKLLCLGYNLPKINFNNNRFNDLVIFDFANIESIHCDGTYFEHISFESSIIDDVYFTQCDFKFIYVHQTNFKKVHITDSHFKNAAFPQCIFKGLAYFFNNVFERISMDYCEFVEGANFWMTKLNNASFSHCIFKKTCLFGTISMPNKKFKTTTIQNGNFTGTEFENATFKSVVFSGNTTFENTKFENCYFNEAIFDELNFGFSEITNNADFTKTTFNEKAFFNNLLFKNQERVFLDGDLQNVSFENTDITRVRFSDNVKFGGIDGYSIIEDIEGRKNPDICSMGTILSIYRNLRENYEYRLRYDEAGKFFIKEMELKREYQP